MRRVLPVLVLLAAACGGGGGGGGHAHGGSSEVAEGARVVRVEARSFAFDPDVIEAEPGEELAIELTATDAEHDFVVDELDAHVAAEAGETATGGLTAPDEPGDHVYYCSVAGHREAGMEGTLRIR